MIWRSLFAIVLLLPFVFLAPWPTDPNFYIFLVISGILFSYQEAESFKLSKNYGGLFLSLQSVIWIGVATILWWLVDPSYFFSILESPIAGPVIITGAMLGIIAQFFLRSTALPEYKSALNKIIVIAIFGGAAVTGVKYAMGHTDSILSVFIWSFLLNIVIAATGTIRFMIDHRKMKTDHGFFDIRVLKAGLVIGLILAIAGPVITFSFAKAPNPGFSNIVTQMSVMWPFLYCHIVGKPIHVRVGGLILTALGAIILIIGTEILKTPQKSTHFPPDSQSP